MANFETFQLKLGSLLHQFVARARHGLSGHSVSIADKHGCRIVGPIRHAIYDNLSMYVLLGRSRQA
jgi:hypothetical protein